MFSRRFLPFLAVFALLSACGGSDAAKTAAPKTVADRFAIKIGDRTVQMQIAALPSEQEKGLMFRTTMGEDEGMLFVFAGPQQQGFWMRNTILPLDIGYIDPTGELREIYPMYPHDSGAHPVQRNETTRGDSHEPLPALRHRPPGHNGARAFVRDSS